MGTLSEEAQSFKSNKFDTMSESYAKYLGKSWLPLSESGIKNIYLKDLPIMMTKDGTLVCIPKLPEMGLIACVGMTGYGKTLVSGYIIDNIFYNWGDNVAIINDSQEETWSWSEANDNLNFLFQLNKINQKPIPLPMVYLLPNSEGLDLDKKVLKQKNSVIISVPFEEVMNNIEKYIPDLGGSKKYLMEKKEELLEAKNEKELMEVIDSIDTGSKGMEEVEKKIETCFRVLIREGILNISDLSIPAYLSIKQDGKKIYSGNPFTAIMKADCIPAFITSDLYTQSHKDAIFSYYISALFEESKSGAMKGTRTWLYFDELTKVVHSDPRYSSPETEKSLTDVASRGRNNGISLIYATQRYNEIPKGIRTQTKFAIVFRHKSDEESEMITKDFGLSKVTREGIKHLQKFEAIAITTEHFVCYKEDRKWEDAGPIEGIIFPPLHKNKFLSLK